MKPTKSKNKPTCKVGELEYIAIVDIHCYDYTGCDENPNLQPKRIEFTKEFRQTIDANEYHKGNLRNAYQEFVKPIRAWIRKETGFGPEPENCWDHPDERHRTIHVELINHHGMTR